MTGVEDANSIRALEAFFEESLARLEASASPEPVAVLAHVPSIALVDSAPNIVDVLAQPLMEQTAAEDGAVAATTESVPSPSHATESGGPAVESIPNVAALSTSEAPAAPAASVGAAPSEAELKVALEVLARLALTLESGACRAQDAGRLLRAVTVRLSALQH